MCSGVLCVLCVETHRRHLVVVTPGTSSLRDTHPPVSCTGVANWRGWGGSRLEAGDVTCVDTLYSLFDLLLCVCYWCTVNQVQTGNVNIIQLSCRVQ